MLKKANMPWSVKKLVKEVEAGNVLFDCAIQRNKVWDMERKSLLMHSSMQNYPIPPLYFVKREDGKYDALDGLQRSDAFGFILGKYALSSNTPPIFDEDGNEEDVSGLYFENLPQWAQEEIKDYNLTIYYFDEGITEEEIAELFFRINNGKPLSASDITRVKMKCLKEFQEIAAHDAINIALSDKAKNSRVDEQVAEQIWSCLHMETPDFNTKVFRPFLENANVLSEHITEIHEALDCVLSIYGKLDSTNKEDKRVLRKVKTKTHLVSCAYLARICINEGITEEEFFTMVYEFFNTTKTTTNESYNNSVGAGVSRAENIQKRLNAMRKLCDDCIAARKPADMW